MDDVFSFEHDLFKVALAWNTASSQFTFIPNQCRRTEIPQELTRCFPQQIHFYLLFNQTFQFFAEDISTKHSLLGKFVEISLQFYLASSITHFITSNLARIITHFSYIDFQSMSASSMRNQVDSPNTLFSCYTALGSHLIPQRLLHNV